MTVAQVLRYKYLGTSCISEYLVNTLPCPEGKTSLEDRLCLPNDKIKTYTCELSTLPFPSYMLSIWRLNCSPCSMNTLPEALIALLFYATNTSMQPQVVNLVINMLIVCRMRPKASFVDV